MGEDKSRKGGHMIITLKSHLESLKEQERARPDYERRDVPTLEELAKAAGRHKGTITRLANGQIQALPFDVGSAIIAELRSRGFDTDLSDILVYRDS